MTTTIKNIDIKNKIINKIKNLKIFILEGYTSLTNKIKSRLNKDCLGKRFINKLQKSLNFKFARDVIPLITIITTKILFLYMIYLTILDTINLLFQL